MNIKNIAPNQTELHTNDGLVIFFSYDTPVAAFNHNGDFVRTSTKYSATSTKHINRWLAGHKHSEVSQETMNNLAGA